MIDYAEIDTVFLDAGNTLISMDFEWVAAELRDRGLACDVASVRRAEAHARPATSEHAAAAPGVAGLELFIAYLGRIIAGLPAAAHLGPERIDALSRRVTPSLKEPGCDYRLWSWVMPGVPEVLRALAAQGLTLAVVSNSDGSVERALNEVGLTEHLALVVDSEIVGYEKPDPRIFAYALERCGAVAARTVHIGDMYFQDVVGANSAGVGAVLLDPYDVWTGWDCERCADLGEFAARVSASGQGPKGT